MPRWNTHASETEASGAQVEGAVRAAAGAVFTGGAGAAPFATGVVGETGAGDAGGCAGRSSIAVPVARSDFAFRLHCSSGRTRVTQPCGGGSGTLLRCPHHSRS